MISFCGLVHFKRVYIDRANPNFVLRHEITATALGVCQHLRFFRVLSNRPGYSAIDVVQ
jgi:hypothetical protein